MTMIDFALSRRPDARPAHVYNRRLRYGPECARCDYLPAVRLREAGALLTRMACSVPCFEVWDFHVGIGIQDAELAGRSGLHEVPADGPAAQYVATPAGSLRRLGLETWTSPTTGKRQWNTTWRRATVAGEPNALVVEAMKILDRLSNHKLPPYEVADQSLRSPTLASVGPCDDYSAPSGQTSSQLFPPSERRLDP